MDSYSTLLEKTRVPQPSLQKLAVISIFEKLRSAPPHMNHESNAGIDAIFQCLHSKLPSVVDQSVRELCRLVKDSKFDLSRGLLELQSALEASDSGFVNIYVKGLGFLVRLGFQKSCSSFRFNTSETHPFVKILSCRPEVQPELVHQVVIFVVQSKHLGMTDVCEFLRIFLNHSIIQTSLSVSICAFLRNLISSMASICCSFPVEAIPVIKLLMGCLKYIPRNNAELVHEAQLCGVELMEAIFSLHKDLYHWGAIENVLEVSRRPIIVQKDLGLRCIPEFSSLILSLFGAFIRSQLEYEQFRIVKLLQFLLEWKSEDEENGFSEEFLFIFPVIHLASSPSRFVKRAATDLLAVLGNESSKLMAASFKGRATDAKFPSISTTENIVFKLLQHLWLQDHSSQSGLFYMNLASFGEDVKKEHIISETWISSLRKYSLWVIGQKKSTLPLTQSQEIFLREMPLILGAIASILLLHKELGNSAVDLLAITSNMDPKLGVYLLLIILFYNHVFSVNNKAMNFHGMVLKLLGILPSLASHPAMTPLVTQTILPLLRKDGKQVLYATAIRLICRTWEINDRVFGSLQGVLLPKGFSQFQSERDICLGMAVSIQDVCRRNPDRGVDLILSVAACIENPDPLIHSLGLQSLAHLCEADVIDFYTAWDVIKKLVQSYLENAAVAHGLCLLLRWGTLDAEAYPESASDVLKILWEVGTSRNAQVGALWKKARMSAFVALTHYKVEQIQSSIPDFKDSNMELLVSEDDAEVLRALEGFEIKVIHHEHISRRRLLKQKRVAASKIEKLLDVFPQVIFPTGNYNRFKELPAAALLCLPFTSKDVNILGESDRSKDVHDKYKNALVEIASTLLLSRNILIALLSLESWKPFMQKWMRASIMLLDAKYPMVLDKTCRAANDILKSMRQIAEQSIPRSAENITLAVGALCLVLPSSAHSVKATASKFLLKWLFQHEHEYLQWSAAISLGLISSSLHITDKKQKFENIDALLEVASTSKSTLVKGACGTGLGFSCQDLLASVDAGDDSQFYKETYKYKEAELLGKVIRALVQMLSKFTPSSADTLQRLYSCVSLETDDVDIDVVTEASGNNYLDLEEDVWGVAGLVLGLGNSIDAIYRSGAYDAVHMLKDLLISWISDLNPSAQNSSVSETCKIALCAGSSLVLPGIMAFCQRVELIHNIQLDNLMNGFRELIAELVSVKRSDTFHQSLLMASCIGAGGLLFNISNGGLHSLTVGHVKDFLTLFRKIYSTPHAPLIHFGAMLGFVNALGAGAGMLVHHYPLPFLETAFNKKESSYITGPLISSATFEPDLRSMMQEIFLVAQNSDDHLLQQYAAWAVSFLRYRLWSRGSQIEDRDVHTNASVSESAPQNLPEDSLVMKLSLWLMHQNPGTDAILHINTVSAILRCLSHSPRLPILDWGAVIRHYMRYEYQVAAFLGVDSDLSKGTLREECLRFSLSHAKKFDQLLSFLDELSDRARFRTLEINLQSCILLHLADFVKIFSGSRLEKLFDDIANFFSWLFSSDWCNQEQKSSLRASCWKGLSLCLDESSLTHDYISNLETCMKVLFTSLWALQSSHNTGSHLEWYQAVYCLGKARASWVLDLLQASEMEFVDINSCCADIVKKIQVKAMLVRNGSISWSELGKVKSYLLNSRSQVIWDALLEVVRSLQHAEGSIKRQWLVDAVEISCVTSYPSTALQFLGLLCGSFCKYMPVLIVDRLSVLSDLPVTVTSLLEDSSWRVVADSVVSYMWKSTERVYGWVKRLEHGDHSPCLQPIDETENELAVFLLRVMHHTCVSLKDYMPPDKQLRVANMLVA